MPDLEKIRLVTSKSSKLSSTSKMSCLGEMMGMRLPLKRLYFLMGFLDLFVWLQTEGFVGEKTLRISLWNRPKKISLEH